MLGPTYLPPPLAVVPPLVEEGGAVHEVETFISTCIRVSYIASIHPSIRPSAHSTISFHLPTYLSTYLPVVLGPWLESLHIDPLPGRGASLN